MECVPGLRASLIKDGECNHVFEGMDLSAAAERVRVRRLILARLAPVRSDSSPDGPIRMNIAAAAVLYGQRLRPDLQLQPKPSRILGIEPNSDYINKNGNGSHSSL